MNDIHKTIQKYIKHYDIYSDGVNTFILLYLPYNPFVKFPKGYAPIDSYYIHSNQIYHIKSAMQKELSSSYDIVKTKASYQKLFLDSGLGFKLKNGLIAIPPFGTRIVLEVIEISGNLMIEKNPENNIYTKKEQQQELLNCENCLNCIRACPSTALSYDGFHGERCIRFLMDSPLENHDKLVSLNSNFLGCEVCQNVCLHNKDIEKVDIPKNILQQLKFETLLENSEKGRAALMPLAEFIGSNYNRPKRLNALCKIAKTVEEKNSRQDT
ncbi:MAG TPA: hypothetical protein GX709_01465 [Clostridiales bacterium]|nr:hypothetical protein [Clostridiales bacterium]